MFKHSDAGKATLFKHTFRTAAGPFEINAPQVDYVELVLFPVLRKLFGVTLELQAAHWPRIRWVHDVRIIFFVKKWGWGRTNRAWG